MYKMFYLHSIDRKIEFSFFLLAISTFTFSIDFNVEAVATKGLYGTGRTSYSSSSNIDYFEERWNKKSISSSSPSQLTFVRIPVHAINDSPTPSLAVRGGGVSVKSHVDISSFQPSFSDNFNPLTSELNIFSKQSWNHDIVIPTANFIQQQHVLHRTRGTLKSTRQTFVEKIQIGPAKKLSAIAFALSEAIFFAGTHLETAWFNIRPSVDKWFEEGRSDNGLFRIDTWQLSGDDHLILQEAWNKQFKTKKFQIAVGCLIGLVTSPAVSVFGAATTVAVGLTFIAAELNHLMSPVVRRVNKIKRSMAMTTLCNKLDEGLENFRHACVNAVLHPKDTIETLKDQLQVNIWLPKTVQKGLIIGILFGILSSS